MSDFHLIMYYEKIFQSNLSETIWYYAYVKLLQGKLIFKYFG